MDESGRHIKACANLQTLSANTVCKQFADYICGLSANTVSRPDIPLVSQFKTLCRVAGICAGYHVSAK
jgi:hypothetical protein